MRANSQDEYLPILQGIAAALATRERITYSDVRPLILERGLSPQIVWPVMRKNYLEVVEKRPRSQGHIYRVKHVA